MRRGNHTDASVAIARHLKGMGRDAMNLVEFPLALLADRAPKGCKTLVFEDRIPDRRQGDYLVRRLTISGSDRYGLPTALDDEVILGLLQLTKAEGFANRRIHFCRYHLLRTLGWRDEGKSYARLDKSLKRWTGVTLYYDNAWRDNREKRWMSASLHLLDEVVLRGRSQPTRRRSLPIRTGDSSHFTWNEIVFESFKAGYLKRLDLGFFRGLKTAAAKRIYRFLDKRFHFANVLRFDLATFGYNHLGLSRRYDAAQLKRRLNPAIDELENAGYLAPLPPEERFWRVCRGKWQVSFVRAPKGTNRESSQRSLSVLEQMLADRGVSVCAAARLVREYAADRIKEKIRVLDALSLQRNAGVLRNPAGFLVESIRQDYTSPVCVQTTLRSRGPASLGSGDEEAKVTRRHRSATPTACHVEPSPAAQFLSRLSPAERSELEQKALSESRGIAADGYRRAVAAGNEALANHYREVIVEQHLRQALVAKAA